MKFGCIIHYPSSPNNTGYITGDSVRSDISRSTTRQLGPFQSAKAKSRRRSRSLSSVIQSYTKTVTAPRTQQIMNRNPRESRSKFRTPMSNRIQSMSVDRCMNPVTPKCDAAKPMTMLRYAKHGETVISLQGSPVVATRSVYFFFLSLFFSSFLFQKLMKVILFGFQYVEQQCQFEHSFGRRCYLYSTSNGWHC